MIIIFDLDYTLLDTKELNARMARGFNLGLDEYFEIYHKYFKGKINYNAYKYINALVESGKIRKEDTGKARKGILKILNDINECLYPDAEFLLKELKKQDYNLILLTFGNQLWQGLKVRNLKIKKYFSRIVITDKIKSDMLDWLKKEKEKIVFINDNAREGLQAKEAIPEAEIILVNGPYSNNAEHGLRVYKLKECLSVIEKL